MSERTNTAIIHIETRRTDLRTSRDGQTRLDEAIGLAKAIDLNVVFTRILNLKKKDSGRLIGKGHLEEIKSVAELNDIELLIVNYKLSPIQQRNLEKLLQIKVIDRTGLILEIFGQRAATREGRWQVDAAHLKYQKSRLVRSWTHLERQRGGRGFLGGPGETQIEADRRALDVQIDAIEKRLEDIKRTRRLQRTNRKRNSMPVVALVGYTNAGKSTLFNKICNETVLAKDMLFATLDPIMRGVELPSGRKIVLSDTVGFVSDLPTELIAAFRATLEEVEFADVILHVRDAFDPDQIYQAQDVWSVLNDIGVRKENEKPIVIDVLNKIDLVNEEKLLDDQFHALKVSAKTGMGLTDMLCAIESALSENQVQVEEEVALKHSEGHKRAWLFAHDVVISETNDEQGFNLRVRWSEEAKSRFNKISN